jgi:hypothetical protein
MKFEFPRQVFEKSLNTKFRQNPSSGIRVVLYVRADGQKDMTKLSFRKFANALKNL